MSSTDDIGTFTSRYEYSGYLSTILYKPDVEARKSLDAVEFTAEDLGKWRTTDLSWATEWRYVPVRKIRTEDGVKIEGDFQDVIRIDSLSPDDPRYWVPLSTVEIKDDRLPIDVNRYPVIEVTYRCTSDRAHPTWLWAYEGGSHFGALPKSKEWITVARNVQHFGFPSHITGVVLRLYSPTRTVESFEVASVRFREMTPGEAEATKKSLLQLEKHKSAKRYPILDEFMPIGVYMDADSAKRLAQMLGIAPNEYWQLVMEDLVSHHHNCVALAHADKLSHDEWSDLLKLGENHGVRFVTRHEFPLEGSEEEQKRIIDTHIRPYADSKAIFCRTFSGEPIENDLHKVLTAKDRIEQADPNHPVAIVARYPNAYPLFAPFFGASGVGHFTSRRPWDLGKMVRTHVPLSDAQQFWVAAPAFMYPTDTPEWSTCPEMRLMANLAMANGARGWFAYSYHNDPVWLRGRVTRTLTGPFLTFSDLWSELMQRMKIISALAPLFLKARPVADLDDWFVKAVQAESVLEPFPGVPPITQHQLQGPDYGLYVTVSNNIRDMAGVNMRIPRDSIEGMEIYDLSSYAGSRRWRPMRREEHIEMFPGQAHIMLRARPEDCERWRNEIASRLVQTDLLKLKLSLQLARTYDLDFRDVEKRLDDITNGFNPDDLETVHSAKDEMTNLIYTSAAISDTNSKLVEISSIMCACDGALCRIMGQGKKERARDLGSKLIPLAREMTSMRIELHNGSGGKILEQCDDLSKRVLQVLARIRSEY